MAYVLASNLLLYLALQAASRWSRLSWPQVAYGVLLQVALTLAMVALNLVAYPASVYIRGLTAEQVTLFSHLAVAGFIVQGMVFAFLRVQGFRWNTLGKNTRAPGTTRPVQSKAHRSGGAKKRRRRHHPRP